MSQGFGSTLGIGLIYDIAGNDKYSCGATKPEKVDPDDYHYGCGQGMGLGNRSYPWINDYAMYGGLGFLVDDGGNDEYIGGTFTQGSSYFMALGAFLDRKGNDKYKGLGSHHQAGDIHLCSSIFIDLEGDDVYDNNMDSNASGNDRSSAFFMDLKGNDTYISKKGNAQGYSRKTSAIAVFVDFEGNDSYTCPTEGDERGQAYAQLGPEPFGQSVVVFLDLNGKDKYNQQGRKDNAEWQLQPGVIGIDTEQSYEEIFDRFNMLNDKEGLDPFSQFHLEYKDAVPTDSKDFVKWVDKWLKTSGQSSNSIIFYPLEQLIDLSISKKLDKDKCLALLTLLKHPDSNIRLFIIKLLGLNPYPEMNSQFVSLIASEKDEYVRKFAIETLGKIAVKDSLNVLVNSINKDESVECRRFAIIAFEDILKKNPDPTQFVIFANALSDKSPDIRFTAAKMLVRMHEPKAVPYLLKLEKDPDIFVKRAVAQALMASGEKKGVPLMISTMTFYSLDNSTYNYGRNVGNILKQYTNQKWGETDKDMIDMKKWQEWWDKNGTDFDIKPFIDAAKLIDEGDILRRDKKDNEAKAKYKEALEKSKGYNLALERIKDLEKKN